MQIKMTEKISISERGGRGTGLSARGNGMTATRGQFYGPGSTNSRLRASDRGRGIGSTRGTGGDRGAIHSRGSDRGRGVTRAMDRGSSGLTRGGSANANYEPVGNDSLNHDEAGDLHVQGDQAVHDRSKDQSGEMQCFNCKKVGHISKDCPEKGEFKKNDKSVDFKCKPDWRDVDAIFKEDADHKSEYANIIDDDEDITVSPIDESVGVLDTWADANIEDKLLQNIFRAGYVRPRKIQAHSIPYIISGRDVLGHAETGSGKTVAYLVPIIDYIMKKKSEANEPEIVVEKYPEPQAVIMLPTRELATQIRDQALKLCADSNVQVRVTYGGLGYRAIIRSLLTGCNILCTTPGIFQSMVKNCDIGVSKIKFFVLDEADRMLANESETDGFVSVLKDVFEAPNFPPKEERINLMFSATYNRSVQELSQNMLMRPDMVIVSNNKWQGSNHRITQNVIQVRQKKKFEKLTEILQEEKKMAEKENPENPKVRPIIIFVATKDRTKQLSLYFTEKGIKSTFINGDMDQELRERALKDFREQEASLLIATDVLARGIDLKDLDHVINCDLTNEITTYIHRIGRTGRLRKGKATTFFDPERDSHLATSLAQLINENGDRLPSFLPNVQIETHSGEEESGSSSGSDNDSDDGRSSVGSKSSGKSDKSNASKSSNSSGSSSNSSGKSSTSVTSKSSE